MNNTFFLQDNNHFNIQQLGNLQHAHQTSSYGWSSWNDTFLREGKKKKFEKKKISQKINNFYNQDVRDLHPHDSDYNEFLLLLKKEIKILESKKQVELRGNVHLRNDISSRFRALFWPTKILSDSANNISVTFGKTIKVFLKVYTPWFLQKDIGSLRMKRNLSKLLTVNEVDECIERISQKFLDNNCTIKAKYLKENKSFLNCLKKLLLSEPKIKWKLEGKTEYSLEENLLGNYHLTWIAFSQFEDNTLNMHVSKISENFFILTFQEEKRFFYVVYRNNSGIFKHFQKFEISENSTYDDYNSIRGSDLLNRMFLCSKFPCLIVFEKGRGNRKVHVCYKGKRRGMVGLGSSHLSRKRIFDIYFNFFGNGTLVISPNLGYVNALDVEEGIFWKGKLMDSSMKVFYDEERSRFLYFATSTLFCEIIRYSHKIQDRKLFLDVQKMIENHSNKTEWNGKNWKSFSKEFTTYVSFLLFLQKGDSLFGKIPKDVVQHGIVPFLDEFEVFLLLNKEVISHLRMFGLKQKTSVGSINILKAKSNPSESRIIDFFSYLSKKKMKVFSMKISDPDFEVMMLESLQYFELCYSIDEKVVGSVIDYKDHLEITKLTKKFFECIRAFVNSKNERKRRIVKRIVEFFTVQILGVKIILTRQFRFDHKCFFSKFILEAIESKKFYSDLSNLLSPENTIFHAPVISFLDCIFENKKTLAKGLTNDNLLQILLQHISFVCRENFLFVSDFSIYDFESEISIVKNILDSKVGNWSKKMILLIVETLKDIFKCCCNKLIKKNESQRLYLFVLHILCLLLKRTGSEFVSHSKSSTPSFFMFKLVVNNEMTDSKDHHPKNYLKWLLVILDRFSFKELHANDFNWLEVFESLENYIKHLKHIRKLIEIRKSQWFDDEEEEKDVEEEKKKDAKELFNYKDGVFSFALIVIKKTLNKIPKEFVGKIKFPKGFLNGVLDLLRGVNLFISSSGVSVSSLCSRIIDIIALLYQKELVDIKKEISEMKENPSLNSVNVNLVGNNPLNGNNNVFAQRQASRWLNEIDLLDKNDHNSEDIFRTTLKNIFWEPVLYYDVACSLLKFVNLMRLSKLGGETAQKSYQKLYNDYEMFFRVISIKQKISNVVSNDVNDKYIAFLSSKDLWEVLEALEYLSSYKGKNEKFFKSFESKITSVVSTFFLSDESSKISKWERNYVAQSLLQILHDNYFIKRIEMPGDVVVSVRNIFIFCYGIKERKRDLLSLYKMNEMFFDLCVKRLKYFYDPKIRSILFERIKKMRINVLNIAPNSIRDDFIKRIYPLVNELTMFKAPMKKSPIKNDIELLMRSFNMLDLIIKYQIKEKKDDLSLRELLISLRVFLSDEHKCPGSLTIIHDLSTIERFRKTLSECVLSYLLGTSVIMLKDNKHLMLCVLKILYNCVCDIKCFKTEKVDFASPINVSHSIQMKNEILEIEKKEKGLINQNTHTKRLTFYDFDKFLSFGGSHMSSVVFKKGDIELEIRYFALLIIEKLLIDYGIDYAYHLVSNVFILRSLFCLLKEKQNTKKIASKAFFVFKMVVDLSDVENDIFLKNFIFHSIIVNLNQNDKVFEKKIVQKMLIVVEDAAKRKGKTKNIVWLDTINSLKEILFPKKSVKVQKDVKEIDKEGFLFDGDELNSNLEKIGALKEDEKHKGFDFFSDKNDLDDKKEKKQNELSELAVKKESYFNWDIPKPLGLKKPELKIGEQSDIFKDGVVNCDLLPNFSTSETSMGDLIQPYVKTNEEKDVEEDVKNMEELDLSQFLKEEESNLQNEYNKHSKWNIKKKKK